MPNILFLDIHNEKQMISVAVRVKRYFLILLFFNISFCNLSHNDYYGKWYKCKLITIIKKKKYILHYQICN